MILSRRISIPGTKVILARFNVYPTAALFSKSAKELEIIELIAIIKILRISELHYLTDFLPGGGLENHLQDNQKPSSETCGSTSCLPRLPRMSPSLQLAGTKEGQMNR